jgi:hypothetical protein
MNDQYLPLDLCKLVYAKVPLLITGADSDEGRDSITLYRLDDLMRAIGELGKQKNRLCCTACAHNLLDAYLSDNLRLDGENVRAFILKMFA